MVVVYLMKIILRGHFLQVEFHTLRSKVLLRVGLSIPGQHLRVTQPHVHQLVAQSQPPRHAVVRTTEQLNLLTPWTHPLNQPVDLVRLATCLTHLADDHIAVQLSVDVWRPLDPHQTVLLCMVQPMPSFPSYDESVDLVCFYPHNLVHTRVPPLS